MTYCHETLALSADWILTNLSFYYHEDLHWYEVHQMSPPSFCPHITPSYHITAAIAVVRGIGIRLSPVHFPSRYSRSMICYELITGWLLLSIPFDCFRVYTWFCLTFSLNLGTLTSV